MKKLFFIIWAVVALVLNAFEENMPEKCPRCGRNTIRPISYGLLIMENPKEQGVILGGCVTGPVSAYWGCLECELREEIPLLEFCIAKPDKLDEAKKYKPSQYYRDDSKKSELFEENSLPILRFAEVLPRNESKEICLLQIALDPADRQRYNKFIEDNEKKQDRLIVIFYNYIQAELVDFAKSNDGIIYLKGTQRFRHLFDVAFHDSAFRYRMHKFPAMRNKLRNLGVEILWNGGIKEFYIGNSREDVLPTTRNCFRDEMKEFDILYNRWLKIYPDWKPMLDNESQWSQRLPLLASHLAMTDQEYRNYLSNLSPEELRQCYDAYEDYLKPFYKSWPTPDEPQLPDIIRRACFLLYKEQKPASPVFPIKPASAR